MATQAFSTVLGHQWPSLTLSVKDRESVRANWVWLLCYVQNEPGNVPKRTVAAEKPMPEII